MNQAVFHGMSAFLVVRAAHLENVETCGRFNLWCRHLSLGEISVPDAVFCTFLFMVPLMGHDGWSSWRLLEVTHLLKDFTKQAAVWWTTRPWRVFPLIGACCQSTKAVALNSWDATLDVIAAPSSGCGQSFDFREVVGVAFFLFRFEGRYS